MFSSSKVRPRMLAVTVLVLLALVAPTVAGAATSTFHRFEAEATANYTVTEQCADGTSATFLVTVIGGHEEESQDGETTLDSDFVTVLLRSFRDCAGNFVNDRGSGTAEFVFSPSLLDASVSGTVLTRDGRTVDVDVTWTGTGQIESTSNTTTFPGFTGHFKGKERDAVATGTVVVDGETLVDGTTTNAEIETLEDTNITTGVG